MIKILAILLFLSSCALEPIYSDKKIKASDISLKIIYDNKSLSLNQRLIYRFVDLELSKKYQSGINSYVLILKSASEDGGVSVIDKEGKVSEYSYNISLVAEFYESGCYVIHNKCKALFSKRFSDSLNYNINSGYYSSQISKDVYRKDLSQEIANDIEQEIRFSLIDN